MELPVPTLDPRPITLDEYQDLTPEKLELYSGYLIDPPEEQQARRALAALLLVNLGLAETVRLAPTEAWEEALRESEPR